MSNAEFFKQTMGDEFDRFRKVIAAVPGDRLDYTPDPKSRTAGALVGHLIGHVQDLSELVDDCVINHRNQVPFDDMGAAVALFEESYRRLEAKLAALPGDAWAKPAEFKVGDHVVMNAPVQALAWMMLFDAVHHRGQLSTYLRPMGSKVPAIYGPSADTETAH